MPKYLFTVTDDKQVRVSILDASRNFSCSLGVLEEMRYDELFWSMFVRQHMTNLHFQIPIPNSEGVTEQVIVDQIDLIQSDKALMYFRKELPPVVVESKLDHLTFTGFAKLALQKQLSVLPKQAVEWRAKQKKKSKKEVLTSWEYQG